MTGRGRRGDRGVSVALNYVLGLAVATLLVSGLLFAAGDVVGDRQETAIRLELRVVGERVATSLSTADRLAESGAETVVVESPNPNRVAGKGYTIAVNATTREVVLETTDPAVTVRVPFGNTTPVVASSASGGDVEVALTAGGDLEVVAS